VTTGVPPFDPEVEGALGSAPDTVVGLVPQQIPGLRARAEKPSHDTLTGGGRFTISRHRPVVGDGRELVVWLWRPVETTGELPVLWHLHGGGLIAGNAFSDIASTLDLAAGCGCAVAAVEYRLAPEWAYPAALEDSYDGLAWLVGNAVALGVAADRIVVQGMSAGAGLAAATVLHARQRGGPRLAGQLLLSPMLDDRNDTLSGHQMSGRGCWDRTANATGWASYLGAAAGTEAVPSTAAPARETDLSRLPRTYLEVGSAETFRDEVVAYAAGLWAAGGEAELHVWEGGCHAFDAIAPEASISRDARRARRAWLRRVLHSPIGYGRAVLTGAEKEGTRHVD
jgi:acetyl esterase/lipase